MYTHTGDPVPPSDKATIDLDPPRYGSIVKFKRLPSGWQENWAAQCEVVVIGRRSIGKVLFSSARMRALFTVLTILKNVFIGI